MGVTRAQLSIHPVVGKQIAASNRRHIQQISLSQQARNLAKKEIERYERDLLSEATRVAGSAEMVLAEDVTRARDNLGRIPNRGIFRHSGVFGGLLLGGALSAVLTYLFAPNPHLSCTALLATFLCTAVGALLLGHHMRNSGP